jgi:predicted porin
LLVATWDKTYLSDTVLPNGKNPEAWQLGASYDFQVAKVSAAWSRMKNGYAGLDGGDPDGLGLGLGAAEFANGGHLDAYLLGVAVPVGAHGTVLAQWSFVQPHWHWQDGEKAKSGQVATLGYLYSLSPRTSLYAMAGLASRYSLDEQVVQGQGTTTRYMAGVTHRF